MIDDPASLDDESPPGVPRWVKAFVLIAVFVILIVLLVLFGIGGEHGPGVHSSAMATGLGLGSVRPWHGHAPWGDAILVRLFPLDGSH